jgi:hypothetical protein
MLRSGTARVVNPASLRRSTNSCELLSRQVEWLKAAAGGRFDRIELSGIAFVVPEDNPGRG